MSGQSLKLDNIRFTKQFEFHLKIVYWPNSEVFLPLGDTAAFFFSGTA